MIDFAYKEWYTVDDLKEIIRLLRSPGGCPWDQEQTHESIRRNLIEEAYEAAEAIDEGSTQHLREELGDVLTQVVFHASIEEDAGSFDLDAVADVTCKKLIFRHPHVFGRETAADSDQVLQNWDALKRQEKGQETHASAMDAVAKSLPALWRAEKIQGKARKAGFDWPDMSGALEKIREETAELETAIKGQTNVEEELGDLLFSVVNLARFLSIDGEEALHGACDKFVDRFRRIEQLAVQSGQAMEEMTLEEMDALWAQAKKLK